MYKGVVRPSQREVYKYIIRVIRASYVHVCERTPHGKPPHSTTHSQTNTLCVPHFTTYPTTHIHTALYIVLKLNHTQYTSHNSIYGALCALGPPRTARRICVCPRFAFARNALTPCVRRRRRESASPPCSAHITHQPAQPHTQSPRAPHETTRARRGRADETVACAAVSLCGGCVAIGPNVFVYISMIYAMQCIGEVCACTCVYMFVCV